MKSEDLTTWWWVSLGRWLRAYYECHWDDLIGHLYPSASPKLNHSNLSLGHLLWYPTIHQLLAYYPNGICEHVTVIECPDLGYRMDQLHTVIHWTGEVSGKAVTRLVEYPLRVPFDIQVRLHPYLLLFRSHHQSLTYLPWGSQVRIVNLIPHDCPRRRFCARHILQSSCSTCSKIGSQSPDLSQSTPVRASANPSKRWPSAARYRCWKARKWRSFYQSLSVQKPWSPWPLSRTMDFLSHGDWYHPRELCTKHRPCPSKREIRRCLYSHR